METKRKKRAEIEEKYKWDLTCLYKNIDDFNKDFKLIEEILENLIDYKTKVMESSKTLLSYLEYDEKLNRKLSNIYVYSNMMYHSDTTNNKSKILVGKVDKLYSDVISKLYFARVEILKTDYSLFESFLNEEPKLKRYSRQITDIYRYKSYTLSDEIEGLLSKLNEINGSLTNIYTVLTDTDFSFGKIKIDGEFVELTQSNYSVFMKSEDRLVRKKAFKTLYKNFVKHKNTIAETYKSNIKQEDLLVKLRGYKSVLESSLYSDDISISVYNNLISTVNANLPSLHKYVGLRKKELGLKDMHMYDMYVDMVDSKKESYSYSKACEIVKKALSIMGSDYLEILDKAFSERWIDVYDNIGKRGGAYSWGTYDSKPFVLLNFNGTLNSISTLAHELGHSVHSYYTNNNIDYPNSGHSIFTAEVASTVNEILLNKYLYETSSDVETKKYLLFEMLEQIKSTLFRQTMFAEFEESMYESISNNEILTEEFISNKYYELNKKYYGSDVIHDEEIKVEWSRIPHFYDSFYVYKYATGISIAIFIASHILGGDEHMLNMYKEFLKSGNSKFPLELLMEMGIDMTDKSIIENAISFFNETLLSIEKLS